jgi:hypothetical protein
MYKSNFFDFKQNNTAFGTILTTKRKCPGHARFELVRPFSVRSELTDWHVAHGSECVCLLRCFAGVSWSKFQKQVLADCMGALSPCWRAVPCDAISLLLLPFSGLRVHNSAYSLIHLRLHSGQVTGWENDNL